MSILSVGLVDGLRRIGPDKDLTWTGDKECLMTTDFLTTAHHSPQITEYRPELSDLVRRISLSFTSLYKHPTCNGSFHLSPTARQCFYVGSLPGLDQLLNTEERLNLDRMRGPVLFGDIFVVGNKSFTANQLKFYNRRLSSLNIGFQMLDNLLHRLNSSYKLDRTVLTREPSQTRGAGWALQLYLVKKGNVFSFEPLSLSRPTVCKCSVGNLIRSMMSSARQSICHLWKQFEKLGQLLGPLFNHHAILYTSNNHELVKMFEMSAMQQPLIWCSYSRLPPIHVKFSTTQASNVSRSARAALIHFSQFMSSFGPECSGGSNREERSIFDLFSGNTYDTLSTNQKYLVSDIKTLNDNQNSLVRKLKEYEVYNRMIAGTESELVRDEYLTSLEVGQNAIAIQLVGRHLESLSSQTNLIVLNKFHFDQLIYLAQQTEKEIADLTNRLAGSQLDCIVVSAGNSGEPVVRCSVGASGVTLQQGELRLHSGTIDHRINECKLYRCFPQKLNDSYVIQNILDGIFIAKKNSTHLFPLNISIPLISSVCMKNGSLKHGECRIKVENPNNCTFIPRADYVIMKCFDSVLVKTEELTKIEKIGSGELVYFNVSEFPIFLNQSKIELAQLIELHSLSLPAVETFKAVSQNIHLISPHTHQTQLRLPGADQFDDGYNIDQVETVLSPLEKPWIVTVLSAILTLIIIIVILFAVHVISTACGRTINCLEKCFGWVTCCCCCCNPAARLSGHDIPLNNLALQQQPGQAGGGPPPAYSVSVHGSSHNSLADARPGGSTEANPDIAEFERHVESAGRIAARYGLNQAVNATDALQSCSLLMSPGLDTGGSKHPTN